MRSMFEHMITVIIMVILLFVFTTLVMVEIQIIGARKVHASAINQIQSSYYTADINKMNNTLKRAYPSWILNVEELKSVNSRKDYKVYLNYDVTIPVFNIKKSGIIEGYAR